MFVSQILIPVAVGMITGLMSGWLSGIMVTHHYRKIDEKQERHLRHIKYLEDTAIHVSKVLNEIDLLIHHEGPLNYENALREIGVIRIPEGQLNEQDKTFSIVREKDLLLSDIEKQLKDDTIDLRQASLQLIKLSVKLVMAIEKCRQEG